MEVEVRGEEDPPLLVPPLSWESTIRAYTQAVSAPPVTDTNLCLPRQEKPSQPLLRGGIFALTHKQGAEENDGERHPSAALSSAVALLQAQLCHTGGTRAHAGQQNITGSKLFRDYFVYCASGF